MKITVHAKPNARINLVEKIDDRSFVVSVKEPPTKGRANRAIVALLAEYFRVSKLDVIVRSGLSGRHKIIEIKGK